MSNAILLGVLLLAVGLACYVLYEYRLMRFARAQKPAVRKIDVTVLPVIAVFLALLIPAPTASAWTGRLQTNYGGLAGWDWQAVYKEKYLVNLSETNYVIFNTTGTPYEAIPSPYDNSGGTYHQFLIAVGYPITFETDTNGYSSFCAPSFQVKQIKDDFRLQPMTNRIFDTSISGFSMGTTPNKYCFGISPSGNSNTVTSLANTKATFSSSYTGSPIPIEKLTLPKPECDVFDLPCWTKDLATDVGDKILGGFTRLLAPDSGKTDYVFQDLNAYMQDKLGFLAYPVTFTVDLLNSFNAGGNWCNESSCSKNFGTIWGQPLTINLTQLKTSAPEIWTFGIVTLRGLTVAGLIFAIRSKYMEVLRK